MWTSASIQIKPGKGKHAYLFLVYKGPGRLYCITRLILQILVLISSLLEGWPVVAKPVGLVKLETFSICTFKLQCIPWGEWWYSQIFLYVVCWVPCTERNRGRRSDCCSTIRCSFVSIVLFAYSVTPGHAAMEKPKQQQCFDFVTGAWLEANHCPVDALVGSGTYYWIPVGSAMKIVCASRWKAQKLITQPHAAKHTGRKRVEMMLVRGKVWQKKQQNQSTPWGCKTIPPCSAIKVTERFFLDRACAETRHFVPFDAPAMAERSGSPPAGAGPALVSNEENVPNDPALETQTPKPARTSAGKHGQAQQRRLGCNPNGRTTSLRSKITSSKQFLLMRGPKIDEKREKNQTHGQRLRVH